MIDSQIDNRPVLKLKTNSKTTTSIPTIDPYRIKAELCKRSFHFFVQEFWDTIIPEVLVDNWHIKYLCDELQTIGMRLVNRLPKDKDLIINVPPSTSKSTICSIMFPAWLWSVDPTLKIISGSYSSALSLEQSTKSRTILQSHKFTTMFPYVILKDDQNNKSNYQTERGGARYTTSTGAMVTGLHAHILLIDDPQNPELANTQEQRNKTNEWVSSTLSTRKVDKDISIMVNIQQRLHPNDVTGYLLSKGKPYKHICLPAELNNTLSPSHLASFYTQSLLDPVRLNTNVLREMKIDLGTKSYNTQILQSPSDDEDSIIKQEWIPIIKLIDFQELISKHQSPIIDFYADTAYTDQSKNDPSAILSCIKINEILYITNVSQVWLEFPELIKHISEFTLNNKYSINSRIKIEPKASGKSIVQYLRKQTNLNIIESKSPTTSKLERLSAISPKFESKKIVLVEGSWNSLLLGEVTSNHPVKDDIRDTVIMAVEDKLIINSNKGKYSFA